VNITLQVDDEVLRRVRKLAIDRRTTLTQLVRDHLEELARHEDDGRQERLQRLAESFVQYRADSGGASWSREDLHER